MSRLSRWLTAVVLLVLVVRAQRRGDDRVLAEPPDDPRANVAVFLLLGLSSLASLAFGAAYLLDWSTELLGLTLGAAFAGLGLAAVVTGRRIVPQETGELPLEDMAHEEDQAQVARLLREAEEGVSRRRLLKLAAGGSAGLAGAAVALPVASLGPVLDTDRLRETPWQAGRRLVDERGQVVMAAVLEVGAFLTAFPEGAERRDLDASVVVARLRPEELRLPPERAGWAPGGLVAYSKSCTHAACAVSLFRHPLHEPTSAEPRLVCPCHFSSFDPARGGEVTFGPAGRPLPQLPLAVTPDGALMAAGEMSGPPGPPWWGVRR